MLVSTYIFPSIMNLHNGFGFRSNTSDDAIICALAVLKKFYQQLKREISEKTNNTIDSGSLLRFLCKSEGESISDVVSRVYGADRKPLSKRQSWKQLKIADRDSPRDIRPIPLNVPPLDANEFKSVSGWSDEDGNDSEAAESDERSKEEVHREPFENPLKIVSSRVLDDDEPSSSSTASTSSSGSTLSSTLNSTERAFKEAQKAAKNVFKIVHKVDKVISPRSAKSPKPASQVSNFFYLHFYIKQFQQTPAPYSSERSGDKITSRYIPQSSKAIQTDFELPIRVCHLDFIYPFPSYGFWISYILFLQFHFNLILLAQNCGCWCECSINST